MNSIQLVPSSFRQQPQVSSFVDTMLQQQAVERARQAAIDDDARKMFATAQLNREHYKALADIERQRDVSAMELEKQREIRALSLEKERAKSAIELEGKRASDAQALKIKEQDFAALKALREKAARYGVSVKGKTEDEINASISKAATAEAKRLKSAIDANNARAASAFESSPDMSKIVNSAVQNVIHNPAIRGALSPQAVAELDKVKTSEGVGMLLSRLKNERGHWLFGIGNKSDASALDSAITSEIASLSQTAQTRDTQTGLSRLKEIADANKALYDAYAKHVSVLSEPDQSSLLIGDSASVGIPMQSDPLAGFAANKLREIVGVEGVSEPRGSQGLPQTFSEGANEGTGEILSIPNADTSGPGAMFFPNSVKAPVVAAVNAASNTAANIANAAANPEGRYAGAQRLYNLLFPPIPPFQRQVMNPSGVDNTVPVFPAQVPVSNQNEFIETDPRMRGFQYPSGPTMGGGFNLPIYVVPPEFQTGVANPQTNPYVPPQTRFPMAAPFPR